MEQWGVINPEGSQLNQPSCPRAKKNPLGRRGRALPSRLCLSRGGEEPLPEPHKAGLSWGGGRTIWRGAGRERPDGGAASLLRIVCTFLNILRA